MTVRSAATVHPTAERKPSKGGAIDGRTRQAQRLREITTGLRAELGDREPTASEAALITQCSTLIVQHEHLLAAAARGEPVDQGGALKLSGLIVRALAAFRGGKAGAKARTPAGATLADYLQRKAAEKAEAAA